MDACRHEILTLVPQPDARLRCRHCHLTISERELGDGCCPECLHSFNAKRRDFEMVGSAEGPVRYRCENCGMIINA